MPDEDNEIDGILARLRQEFIETARDQIDDIEIKLDQVESGIGDAHEHLLSIQRHIHNIKGQGATFGFPLTGRVAHMLEDYLKNCSGFEAANVHDVHAYLDMMQDLIFSDEVIGDESPEVMLNRLPTGQVQTFSTQKTHDINVLLVMPSGLQRKMVSQELLSCGFRVMRAYDTIEALSVAMDITPDVVFVNYDMTPFSGPELARIFAAVERLSDVHIVLLTGYELGDEHLQGLPDNLSVVEKRQDFSESIGQLLMDWGVFGKL